MLVKSDIGLEGAVSAEMLRSALEKNPSAKLSDVVPQYEFPHVHSDHTIAQALDRMASARMDLLPVVSRANARILEGVVTLRDVLDRYGISS